MLNLEIKRMRAEKRSTLIFEEESLKDIAVIGLSARLPQAEDPDAFWNLLCSGFDAIETFPGSRQKDVKEFIEFKGEHYRPFFCRGSYLTDIDKFDHPFFKITAKEASLMDPNQRLFLETCWKAIEDAGYGGSQLSGTCTGVYVGYSGKGEYQTFVSEVEPESVILSETGNIQSIIASRISYILDLKGPSMLIDTACSSSLVAVHAACQALLRQECDVALTGSIKITLMPLESVDQLGIESRRGMTRTFDDGSDGTVFGEGCVTLVLKPLQRALRDHDHIYAVIKGSAINQDGRSVGITAPNVRAQEECIVQAWQHAGVEPDTVAYIEAHGTGTPLGDPIEIQAITQAFRRFTENKQFCGVGSVKSVYGHLDHAAGILGLLKVILMLKHGFITPTLHFAVPNRNIDFVGSPVYIAQHLEEWKTHDAVPRRCGINSFGLSGTNCHMVLEEAPLISEVRDTSGQQAAQQQIFTLSAHTADQLRKMATAQRLHYEERPHFGLNDVCFTLNTGRTHGMHRLAIIAADLYDLIRKLTILEQDGLMTLEAEGIYYGFHAIVPMIKEERKEGELSATDKDLLTTEAEALCPNAIDSIFIAQLKKLCELYIQGADIPWSALYPKGAYKRLSLPGYSFARIRCWPEVPPRSALLGNSFVPLVKRWDHPLLNGCLWEAPDMDIYVSQFSMNKQWVLKEHKIAGSYLMPGTAYLEMIYTCCLNYFPGRTLEIKDVMFVSPLSVDDTTCLEVQMVVKKLPDRLEILIASRSSNAENTTEWIRHCEATALVAVQSTRRRISLDELQSRLNSTDLTDDTSHHQENYQLEFGPRWSSLLTRLCVGQDEVLAELNLPERFHSDLAVYNLHPSLLDIAVNAVTQVTGNGLYLPLCYETIGIFSPLPARVFSHIRKRKTDYTENETVSFDVTIYDAEGYELFQAENFTVKKVHVGKLGSQQGTAPYYQIRWIPCPAITNRENVVLKNGACLLIRQQHSLDDLKEAIKGYTRVIDVVIEEPFRQLASDRFVCSGSPEDYDKLFQAISGTQIETIVHMSTLEHGQRTTDALEQLQEDVYRGIMNLKHMIHSMIRSHIRGNIEIVLLSTNAHRITGNESIVLPQNAAYLAWGQGISKEYPQLSLRAIDIDEHTSASHVAAEISKSSRIYLTALRGKERYQKELIFAQISHSRPEPKQTHNGAFMREEGVYLITGGTGALGSEFAMHLASKGKIQIALVSRSAEDHSSWNEVQGRRMLQTIEQVSKTGSTVEMYGADVGDKAQMRKVIQRLRERYGRINGIVHAAGVSSKGFLINRTSAQTEQVLAPKIYGTWLLQQLTDGDDLDFFVSFSSISSLYGMPGQADYSAANAYLDAFTGERIGRGRPALSVNWAPWEEIGMAAEHGVRDTGVFSMLSVSEGIASFDTILTLRSGSIIVGRINEEHLEAYAEELDMWIHPDLMRSLNRKLPTSPAPMRKETDTHAPRDVGGNLNSVDDIQAVITEIWSRILGYPDISIYDSFSTMGGDSITATRLFRELERIFPGSVDIGSVFAHPSVLQMTNYLKSQLPTFAVQADEQEEQGECSDDLLDEVLRKVRDHTLSVEEALGLI
ncbi:type I polyketide synthase [Paenibacillus oleatilyticus]|uniref:SDR family NAD(P)-dependent oxidoreductase n=1 Tax=Paenibacillus oleatilyticus TaxID=2594886 RepID=A0ABV4VA53_9BACL